MSDSPQTPGTETDPMRERPPPEIVKSLAGFLGAILRYVRQGGRKTAGGV